MIAMAVSGFIGGFGPTEILLILLIVLVLFGASRIPDLARSMGKGVSEFKKGLRGEEEGNEKKQIEEKKTKAIEDKDEG